MFLFIYSVLVNIMKQIYNSVISNDINLQQYIITFITLFITAGGVIVLQQSVRSIPILTSKLLMKNLK